MLLCTGLMAQRFDIQILGIAQDAGIPQAGCQKSCCQNIDKEMVSSLAIHEGNKFWLIDATPDFTKQLALAQLAYPESELAGIFLTHAHIGHYTGLMYLGREAMNTHQLPVYCLPRMAEFLKSNGPWKQLIELENIRLIELQPNQGISISGNVTITPIDVPHRDEYSETAAYIIASEEKKALYVPDIDKWDKWSMTLEGYLDFVDVALIDGTFFSGDELPGRNMDEIPHPFVIETMKQLEGQSAEMKSKVYFIHLNHSNPLLKKSVERLQTEKAGYHIARAGMLL